MVLTAYPYIKVTIDTRGLQPRAARAVGNLGIVGSAGGAGSPTANLPVLIASEQDARTPSRPRTPLARSRRPGGSTSRSPLR